MEFKIYCFGLLWVLGFPFQGLAQHKNILNIISCFANLK